MNTRRMALKKMKSELKFAMQFGKLNNPERDKYWDGRVDGLWLAVDILKRYIERFDSKENSND
jgi:hypothetical protein